MGQPEDYKVDEEIFNDSAPNEKQQTKRPSSHKQVFRDTDDKFIAGVSSGLGHYFGIDAIWIRLVWVALVFLGFGAPILIYILLMILIPEATTTSEKLKMKREPVTVPLKRIRSLGWEHWPSKRKKSSSMLVLGRSNMLFHWFKSETDAGLTGVNLPESA